jgi:pimeloyl-ACP methyl ester carboxylesterase
MGHPDRIGRDDALALFHGALGCAVVADALAIAASSDAFGVVRPTGVPTRILYGTADRIITWPNHYARMQRMLPDAEYVPLDGLGHLPMWEDADLVARRILEVSAPARSAA